MRNHPQSHRPLPVAFGLLAFAFASCFFLALTSALHAATVTNLDDNGTGSLRAAVAAANSGETIDFAANLNGGAILLTGPEIVIDKSLIITAFSLPQGIYIDACGNSRIFNASVSGKTIQLRGLNLSGGNSLSGFGGAIRNNGSTLSLSRCNIYECVGSGGGAIVNLGMLTIFQSAFYDNRAAFGGAISSQGAASSVNIFDSTLSGNRAEASSGGALRIDVGTLTMEGVTLTENRAATSGGGIQIDNSANLSSAVSCIVAGNTASTNPDSSVPPGSSNLTGADPGLARLGFYGGRTACHPPLLGSPAIGSSTALSGLVDQRSFVRPSTHDRGAAQSDLFFEVINKNDSGAGSLRQALADADAASGRKGTMIHFAPAAFTPGDSTITLASDATASDGPSGLLLNAPVQGLAIYAGDIPGGVTIDAAGTQASPRRVLELADSGAEVTLHSLTLTGGRAASGLGPFGDGGGGGGILSSGELVLHHSTVRGNRAGDGGSTGIDNSGGHGGGIRAAGALAITHSTIVDNRAGDGGLDDSGGFGGFGGGIVAFGTLAITHSTIADNRAGDNRAGDGGGGTSGGIEVAGPQGFLRFSTLSGNVTGTGSSNGNYGGGLLRHTSLLNCTISGNHARRDSGGVSAGGHLVDCTIADNVADGLWGGLSGVDATISGCLIVGNRDGGGANSAPDLRDHSSLTFAGPCLVSDATGAGSDPFLIVNAAPLVAPLGDYGGTTQTHMLLLGSPAIDMGSDATGCHHARTDQRGHPRIVGTKADIGAVEFQGNLSDTWSLDLDGDGVPGGLEHLAGTDPTVADPCGTIAHPELILRAGDLSEILFGWDLNSKSDTSWRVEASTDLQTWHTAATFTAGDTEAQIASPEFVFSLGNVTLVNVNRQGVGTTSPVTPRHFWRVRAEFVAPQIEE